MVWGRFPKLRFAKEGDKISLLGPDGEPCSDVWEVCARNQPGRKPAPEGASNGLYSDERDFYLRRGLVEAPMPHLSTRVAIIKRRDEMKKLVRVGSLKVGEEFETQGGATLVVKYKGGNCVIASTVLGATYNTALPGGTKVFIALADEDYERDYSLLRPLDPTKLEQGDNVIHLQGEREVTYIAGPDEAGGIVVLDSGDRLRLRQARWYRMKPLTWIAGRPVYPGDELYLDSGKVCKIEGVGTGYFAKGIVDPLSAYDGPVRILVAAKRLSWDRPKVKKEGWINIYRDSRIGHYIHETEADANQHTDVGRIACARVEWEE